MRSRRLMTRVAALLAAAGMAVAVATPVAAEQRDTERQDTVRFSATAGDGCFAAAAEGTLTWVPAHTPRPHAVPEIAGTLTKGPSEDDLICPAVIDPRTAIATFTAYRGERVVDSAEERTTGAPVPFRFTLRDVGEFPGIERVEIQVCLRKEPSIGPIRPGQPPWEDVEMFPNECGEPLVFHGDPWPDS